MAISFIGGAENSAINGNDVTLTLPGGLQQNDLVIVSYAIGDNDSIDFNMAMVTTGYTEVADLFADDTQDCNLGVFYKFMGATPDTTAVVDGLGGADAAVAAVCLVFRGVDTGTPFDVSSTTATALDTMHPDPPSIDYVTATGVWTVIAGASGHTLGGAGTYTFPTGYTTNAIDRGSDDTSDVTVGMGYRTNPADPENPGVMTHSGTDSANFAWCAVSMALRELAAQVATDSDTPSLTGESAASTANVAPVDTETETEGQTLVADATIADAYATAETAAIEALLSNLDAPSLSDVESIDAPVSAPDSGTISEVASASFTLTATDTDTGTVAEIEALLAEIADNESGILTEISDPPPQALGGAPEPVKATGGLGPSRRPLVKPIEDDALELVGAWQAWYDGF